jgi:hypothetical protein
MANQKLNEIMITLYKEKWKKIKFKAQLRANQTMKGELEKKLILKKVKKNLT